MPEDSTKLSVRSCLESLDILLLRECDLLFLVYRHGASLTTAEQFARLMGYDSTVFGDALDQLERKKLIEHPRQSKGVGLYRISASLDGERRHCLEQVTKLMVRRAGWLELENLLNPGVLESGAQNSRETPGGETYVRRIN